MHDHYNFVHAAMASKYLIWAIVMTVVTISTIIITIIIIIILIYCVCTRVKQDTAPSENVRDTQCEPKQDTAPSENVRDTQCEPTTQL